MEIIVVRFPTRVASQKKVSTFVIDCAKPVRVRAKKP